MNTVDGKRHLYFSYRTRMETSRLRGMLGVCLSIWLLFVSTTGRAGVQVVHADLAWQFLAVHIHGVTGEAEYVRANGGPAPFIHAHCHRAPGATPDQPDPDTVQAAGSLAGTMLCPVPAAIPFAVQTTALRSLRLHRVPTGLVVTPLSPPPQTATA